MIIFLTFQLILSNLNCLTIFSSSSKLVPASLMLYKNPRLSIKIIFLAFFVLATGLFIKNILLYGDLKPKSFKNKPFTIASEIKTPFQSFAYYVSPQGNDNNPGTSDLPFKTIQKALDVALPGETINLAPGIYLQDFVTKRGGKEGSPITITGPREAIVRGAGRGRVAEINHSYITLSGFTIDGKFASSNSEKSYRDKLIYALGKEPKVGITGTRIYNMDIMNAGGECIRLRYFTRFSEIAYNTIKNCGVHDFSFDAGGKNGEGVYIGTAPEQLKDKKNPTSDPDESSNNWIHHNDFDTQGNECVDIKEGATRNVIENNKCTGQKDKNSGGFDSRGDYNIFRFNEVFGNLGAGIRLGGDENNDGTRNDIYSNIIRNNKSGGVKFQREPQGKICGNTMKNNSGGNSVGSYGSKYNPAAFCLI